MQSELEGRIAFKTMRVIPNFFYSCVVQRKWCAPLLPHPHLLMGHLSAHQLDGASPHRVSCCNLLKPLLASQYECAFFCAVLHSLKGIFFFRGEHRATFTKILNIGLISATTLVYKMLELTSCLLLFQCLLAEMASCVHNLAQLSAQRVRLSVQSTTTTTGAPCLWHALAQLLKAKTQCPFAPRMLAPMAAFTLLNLTAQQQIRLVPLELTLRDVTWASTAIQWLRIAPCHLCHPHHSKC